jgi:four helix bundle protein
MIMAHPWKDLIVWQKAHELVLDVYRVTVIFPDSERYGLTQQIRRSSVSIAANIVEGKSKKTDKEFLVFLYNSRGSLEETRYHLLLSHDLGYLDENHYEKMENMASEVSYLLNKLISTISK